jgi:hypothetical protein
MKLVQSGPHVWRAVYPYRRSILISRMVELGLPWSSIRPFVSLCRQQRGDGLSEEPAAVQHAVASDVLTLCRYGS